MSVTGVIQAGGKSTRMGGRPKALMELGGRRIIERVVDVMRGVTDDLLIVTNTSDAYASLGGIYSGLRAASRDSIFTVACDMPFLLPDVARLVTDRAALADVIVPVVSGRFETLHACYAKSCLGPMESKLRAGHLKIAGFFDAVRVLTITEDEVARFRSPDLVFMNVNTPEEMAEAREHLASLERRSRARVAESPRESR